MNEGATTVSEHETPLVQANDLRLRGWRTSLTFEVRAQSLFLMAQASDLVRAFVEPDLIETGTLSLSGTSASRLLSSGTAGYCPRSLPAPASLRVRSALRASGRLLGLSKEALDEAMHVCQLEPIARKTLDRLTPVQEKLVGLAHGMCSRPELFLVEDMLSDLDDEGAEVVSGVMDRILDEKRFVMAGTSRNSPSREWRSRAAQILSEHEGTFEGPEAPERFHAEGHWVLTEDDPEPLRRALGDEGVEVAPGLKPGVLLVLAPSQLIFAHAARSKTTIKGLAPYGKARLVAGPSRDLPGEPTD